MQGDDMKTKNYIAGLYFRLSKDDERQGESLSIENQRRVLRKYAEDNGFEIHDEYIDDGVSGTTFDRPEVQRLLDDAKTGVINTIIVKDLSVSEETISRLVSTSIMCSPPSVFALSLFRTTLTLPTVTATLWK